MDFGEQIKSIRQKEKLTQEQFAMKLNVSRQAVSNWENNKNLPDIGMLILMSDVFQISLDYLIKGENEMNNMTEKVIKDGSETRRAKYNMSAIEEARLDQDSVGGVIECAAVGVPAGLGSPMLDTVEGRLSSLLFSVPAVKGVEFGVGFGFAEFRGSHANDTFTLADGDKVVTETNNNGGVLGGITSGMPLIFRTVIKPTPSISKPQRTLNLASGEMEELRIKGRHDPCIVTRAAPVIEAAAAVALTDLYLEGYGYARTE